MTVHTDRLQEILTRSIQAGGHTTMDDGACVMELVSYVAAEPWTDRPGCVCPVIGAFLRSWNDGLPSDGDRDRLLKPLIPRVIGSRATPAVEERRAWMALDWMIRVHTPAWLELAGIVDHARILRELSEIVDDESLAPWDAARAAAGDAAGAAAWAAARAAAWDAARAAARDAAWDAARAAAGAAAWDAAGAAAGAAARTAAWDAARTADGAAARAAAWKQLGPTVADLQQSALALLDRMLAVSEASS